MEDAPPFFIVGSARSGTTLLRLMLNAHAEVAVPPESRFITELWTGRDEVEVADFLNRLANHKRFQQWGLPIEAIRAELAGATRAPYPEVASAPHRAYAHTHGKTRWGDKTPRYIEQIPVLVRLFPSARFVHLVRDGRNVALSYADVPFGPKTVPKAAALWAERVSAGIASGRELGSGRYLEMRYEHLVEDAAGEIKALCEFLDLPFDATMLNYGEDARSAVLPTAADYNPYVLEKPRTDVRAWEQSMTPRQVEVFEAEAGDVLSRLGYERRYPSPSVAARATARLGSLGFPVARLRSTRRTRSPS